MDLETENRIAAILLKEAAELRRQSEREGVLAYLRQPKARGKPNSRFLTATVLGVQQANRSVEVNEMWRVRQKERELDDRLRKQKDESSSSKSNAIVDKSSNASWSSRKRVAESCYSREDEGLRDEEVEEFLHSRVKRGRGAVGSRMDETGPYLPPSSDSKEQLSTSHDIRDHRVVIGPEKPSSLKSCQSSSSEELHEDRRKKPKKSHTGSSKEHFRKRKHKHKHRSKEKSKDKKKERRSKNY